VSFSSRNSPSAESVSLKILECDSFGHIDGNRLPRGSAQTRRRALDHTSDVRLPLGLPFK